MYKKQLQKQGKINPSKVGFTQDSLSSKWYGAGDRKSITNDVKPSVFMNGDIIWLREFFLREKFQGYQAEMKSLIKFSARHCFNIGWTKIKKLPDLGNIYNRKVAFLELKNTIFKNLTDYGHFTTDDAIGTEYVVKDSFVFACDDKVFFYGIVKNEFVKELNIEYNGLDNAVIERTADILHIIGCKYNLMLADWRTKIIVDLSNKKNILAYLNKSKI